MQLSLRCEAMKNHNCLPFLIFFEELVALGLILSHCNATMVFIYRFVVSSLYANCFLFFSILFKEHVA